MIERIIEKVREIPTRPGNIGGQNYKYVRLEEVIGLLLDALDSYEAKTLPEPFTYIGPSAFEKLSSGYAMSVFCSKHAMTNRDIPLYAEPTARNYWKEFTYKEALCGIYWVCGTYPEYDIDDSCRTIGAPTGESCKFISLVYIDFNPEDPAAMMVDAIDCHNLGSFSDEHLISHYMEFEIPAHGIKEQE